MYILSTNKADVAIWQASWDRDASITRDLFYISDIPSTNGYRMVTEAEK